MQEFEKIKKKWDMPLVCAPHVLYEAGQDGFWIERALSKSGAKC